MGQRILTNNIDKWEVFSTVSDSVIAEFKTESGLKRFLAMEAVYDGKLKAIEHLMTFPYKRSVNDTLMSQDNKEGMDSYYEWVKSTYNLDTYEEYYKAVDDKLAELLEQNPEEE